MRSQQLTLTIQFAAGPLHRNGDPHTSVDAAQAQTPARIGAGKRVVLSALLAHGPSTDDQLAIITDRHPGSMVKRRGDLVADGLVEDSELLRQTRTGCAAIVWQLTDEGFQVARGLS